MNGKVASFQASPEEVELCVLLYSGGLDTSCMLKWIQEHYDADVISLTLNLGQSKDFRAIEKKARDLEKYFKGGSGKAFLKRRILPGEAQRA